MIQNSGHFLQNIMKIFHRIYSQDMETLSKLYHKRMKITDQKSQESEEV